MLNIILAFITLFISIPYTQKISAGNFLKKPRTKNSFENKLQEKNNNSSHNSINSLQHELSESTSLGSEIELWTDEASEKDFKAIENTNTTCKTLKNNITLEKKNQILENGHLIYTAIINEKKYECKFVRNLNKHLLFFLSTKESPNSIKAHYLKKEITKTKSVETIEQIITDRGDEFYITRCDLNPDTLFLQESKISLEWKKDNIFSDLFHSPTSIDWTNKKLLLKHIEKNKYSDENNTRYERTSNSFIKKD